MKKKLFWISSLTILLIFELGCENMKKNDDVVKLIGIETRKALDANAEKNLILKMNEIKLGDNLNKVISLLGTPTYSQGAADKQTGDLKMIIIKYYFSSTEETVNSKSSYLTLYFDKRGALEDSYTNYSVLQVEHLVKQNK